MMRAAIYSAIGGPEVVKVVENAPLPAPGKDQVLVQVGAAAINGLDIKVRRGQAPGVVVRGNGAVWPPKEGPHPPYIPGSDVAGVVESAPAGAPFAKGQRVVAWTDKFGFGTFAEYVALPAKDVVALPDGVSMTDAAAGALVGVTALQMLKKLGRPGGKEARAGTLLVNGGAGGVGSMAVQLATQRGFQVTATASDKNADKVKSLGAVEVLDYKKMPDYESFAASKGGFDGILDTVGSSWAVPQAAALKPSGLFVRLATDFSLMLMLNFAVGAVRRALFLGGPRYTLGFAAPNGPDLAEVVDGLSKGTIKAQVDKVFTGLGEAAAAQRYAEEGRPQGKVVLIVDPAIK